MMSKLKMIMRILKGNELVLVEKEDSKFNLYKTKRITNRGIVTLLANALNNLI